MSVLSTELDRLLSPKEVAEVLSCGRSYVYELLGGGELPSRKINGMRRVWFSDLRNWIDSH
jgi:excisionase family DNA binding protein